jgi:hypothetical protein
MSLRFASNSAVGQPPTTKVRSSWVGIAANPRPGRTYVSNRPSIGRPLQYE